MLKLIQELKEREISGTISSTGREVSRKFKKMVRDARRGRRPHKPVIKQLTWTEFLKITQHVSHEALIPIPFNHVLANILRLLKAIQEFMTLSGPNVLVLRCNK